MITIRNMVEPDGKAVLEIYKQGIDTGQATFQTEAPSWESWDQTHVPDLRYVAVQGQVVAGWVALSPVSSRCVYAGIAEVSVYIGPTFRGMGVASLLLEHLIEQSEDKGYWTLQASIFPENSASIRLHKKFGFREIGYRERVGKMNNVWRNTVLLERRSIRVGID